MPRRRVCEQPFLSFIGAQQLVDELEASAAGSTAFALTSFPCVAPRSAFRFPCLPSVNAASPTEQLVETPQMRLAHQVRAPLRRRPPLDAARRRRRRRRRRQLHALRHLLRGRGGAGGGRRIRNDPPAPERSFRAVVI